MQGIPISDFAAKGNRMRVLTGLLSCALLALTLTGCGDGRDADLPDLVPVSGIVTMDGEPVAGVNVLFSPVGSTSGGMCYANTDEAGKYVLTDSNGREGAPMGEFEVTCSKWAMPDGSDFKSDDQSPMEAGAVPALPAKYGDAISSGLKAAVPAGGGTFDFKLESK
jgi:hypothetical protein